VIALNVQEAIRPENRVNELRFELLIRV